MGTTDPSLFREEASLMPPKLALRDGQSQSWAGRQKGHGYLDELLDGSEELATGWMVWCDPRNRPGELHVKLPAAQRPASWAAALPLLFSS